MGERPTWEFLTITTATAQVGTSTDRSLEHECAVDQCPAVVELQFLDELQGPRSDFIISQVGRDAQLAVKVNHLITSRRWVDLGSAGKDSCLRRRGHQQTLAVGPQVPGDHCVWCEER